MGRAKQVKNVDKFQSAVAYLAEYSGVKGVVIADTEGLVLVAKGNADFQPESLAAYSMEIINSIRGPLQRLLSPVIEHLAVKTAHDWLTIARSGPLLLIVAADRHANDLLNIRISRSLDMISIYMKERYGLVASGDLANTSIAKSLEEIHV